MDAAGPHDGDFAGSGLPHPAIAALLFRMTDDRASAKRKRGNGAGRRGADFDQDAPCTPRV
jgi:hypothetical protein